MGGPRPRILAFFGARVLFGQERANIESLATLRDQGCDVLCLARDEAWVQPIREALHEQGLETERVPYIDGWLEGYRLRTLVRNPVALVRANLALRRIVRRFRPTHLYCFNPMHAANFLPALAWSRLPLVYRVGDKPTVHNRFWRALWRAVVRRTSVFVANSEFIRQAVADTGADPGRIRVIHCAPPRRAPHAPCVVPQAFAQPDQFRVVYVGQVIEQKGVGVLVDAFAAVAAEFPAARLLIAGRITDWAGDAWARRLRDRVAQDPALRDKVSFLGFIEDVPGLLRQCHVHVCPSILEEAFGLVVVEAKAEARPSIVFPRGGLPELVRHQVDGWLCPSPTVEALTAALRHYLQHPGDAAAHGREARASLEAMLQQHSAARWLEALAATAGG